MDKYIDCHLTVGRLRKVLESLPDDMPVYYQRIEDFYFQNHNWTTTRMLFEPPDNYSDYVRAFTALKHWHENAFVINAHY